MSLAATGFTGLQVGATAGSVTFTNVAANTGLTIDGNPSGGVTYNLANASGAADVLPLTLQSAAVLTVGTVTAAGIETVNITNTDTDATAHTNSLTLTAAAATSVTVAGNAGLNLTATSSTAVTNFNASGVTGAAADAAALAVTYASLNVTSGASVSITGGSGNDVLSGNITIDTISGGAGNDTINGYTGADTLDGGTGTNTINYANISGITNVEGAGTGTTAGIAINLGSTAVTAATINAALGGTNGLSGSSTSLAAGTAQYVYATQSNLFATTTDTLTNFQNVVGSTGGDYIVGSSAANNISNQLAGSQRGSAGDALIGGGGADTFNLFGSTASGTFGTVAAATSKVSDFAVASDVFAVSDTIVNYLDFSTSITSITGDAAVAGSTGIQSVAKDAAAAALTAGTDLIKLTTTTAVTGTTQVFFNAAIGSATVTGLAAAETGVFVLAYDSTNSQAVLMLASTGANAVLATADVVQLVGTMSMSAADFGNLTNVNFAMLA